MLTLTVASVLLWIPKVIILSVHNLKIRDNTSPLCCENEYMNDYNGLRRHRTVSDTEMTQLGVYKTSKLLMHSDTSYMREK